MGADLLTENIIDIIETAVHKLCITRSV